MKLESFQETKNARLIIGIKVSDYTHSPGHAEEFQLTVGVVDPDHDEHYEETARNYLELARVMAAAPRVAASLQKMVGTVKLGAQTKKDKKEVEQSPIIKEAMASLALAGYA
jgi:hypothetical protein